MLAAQAPAASIHLDADDGPDSVLSRGDEIGLAIRPMATIFRLYRLLRNSVRVFESQAVPSAVRSRSGSSKALTLVESDGAWPRSSWRPPSSGVSPEPGERRVGRRPVHHDGSFDGQPVEESERGVHAARERERPRVMVGDGGHPRRERKRLPGSSEVRHRVSAAEGVEAALDQRADLFVGGRGGPALRLDRPRGDDEAEE